MDIREHDQKLNEMIKEGKNMEAVEMFYAENAVTEEVTGEKNDGMAAIKEAHVKWGEDLVEHKGAELLAVTYADNMSMAEWHFKFVSKTMGDVDMKEVAVRKWNDEGKIIHEKYYYNSSMPKE